MYHDLIIKRIRRAGCAICRAGAGVCCDGRWFAGNLDAVVRTEMRGGTAHCTVIVSDAPIVRHWCAIRKRLSR
jgi:hypothetical protein